LLVNKKHNHEKIILLILVLLFAQWANAQCNLNFSVSGGCGDSIATWCSNGTPPYSYSINPISGTQGPMGFANVALGTYTLTVADANGCTATAIETVSASITSATISTTNATCTGTCDGSVTINITGGNSAVLIYYINNTAYPNATISNLCPGTYQGYVTDNCSYYIYVFTIGVQSAIVLTSNIIQPTACGLNGQGYFLASG
jgi:hypothetical protein